MNQTCTPQPGASVTVCINYPEPTLLGQVGDWLSLASSVVLLVLAVLAAVALLRMRRRS